MTKSSLKRPTKKVTASKGRHKKHCECSPHFSRPRDYFNVAIIVFVIGCIFGTYYEQIFMLITVYMRTREIFWESRTGLIYGPFSPIYGTGGIVIYSVLCLWRDRHWYEYFLVGAFLGGALEYVMAVGQEVFFGTRSWDYSDKPFNLDGRTTIPYAFIWGALFVIFSYFVFPHIYNLYRKVASKKLDTGILVIAIFLLFDISISCIAARRQYQRHKGIDASTFIDRFCDEHYTDDYLKKIYENAVPVDQ